MWRKEQQQVNIKQQLILLVSQEALWYKYTSYKIYYSSVTKRWIYHKQLFPGVVNVSTESGVAEYEK